MTPNTRAGLSIIALAAALGCNEDPVQPALCQGIAAMVAGPAAQALDANGCFVLPSPTFATHQGLTQALARGLAAAAGPQFLPILRSYIEAGHGGPIDFARLAPCGPVYLADTPLDPLPPTVVSAYQNEAGPRWLVALCDESARVQVSVGIAAYASYLTVQDAQVAWPTNVTDVFGNEFLFVGAPASWPGPLATGAEQAVRLVHQATGQLIVSVPKLYLRDPTLAFPQGALWAVHVQSPLRVQGTTTGTVRETDTLFVGLPDGFVGRPQEYGPAVLEAASPVQPTTTVWLVPPDYMAALDSTSTAGWKPAQRRSDVPLRFEPVLVLK